MTNVPTRNDNDFIQSASVTAMMRALLSNCEGKLKNPDRIAKYYVSSPWSEFLKNPEESRENLQKRVPGCMYYHLVRTKKFDESLVRWVANNPHGKILILGAGFDSRSIRLKNELKNIKIFEFDLKRMLNYKQDIIRLNKNLAENENVNYIAINFHEENLIDKFENASINKNTPTYVLWEGVSYFLEEKTVVSTLKSMAEYFVGPLNIIFDYAYENYISGDLNYYGAPELAEELKAIGEPHIFGLNPNEISAFLRNINYQILYNSPAEKLEKQFLVDADGNLISRIHGFHGIVECTKIYAFLEKIDTETQQPPTISRWVSIRD